MKCMINCTQQLGHLCAARTPVVRRVEGILTRFTGGGGIVNDHIAFRTFGARGFGIESVAPVFTELGYTARDTLTFPAKKLDAQWFAPPPATDDGASPLPRVFISELKVRRHRRGSCLQPTVLSCAVQKPALQHAMP
jgi:hypothetical protein